MGTIQIHEFDITKMPRSCTWFVIGPPGTGKSRFIADMAYYTKHIYPVARVFSETEDSNTFFGGGGSGGIFPPLFVSEDYSEEAERNHVLRQKLCKQDSDCENGSALNILDDCSKDPKIYRSILVQNLFKNGSRHWDQLCMVGLQYAIDVMPVIRKCVSYVALLREAEVNEREKLYKNFGGLAGSFKNFCDLMDQLTDDHTALIINKRSQSNDPAECFFYYKAEIHEDDNGKPNWKFGCNEYWEWSKKRYNKGYQGRVIA
uniref:Uncharacterized protein n=1 Tax=viral metagenome TaxID=1070528 RepID=A0A6C0LYY3_9ZZZZ